MSSITKVMYTSRCLGNLCQRLSVINLNLQQSSKNIPATIVSSSQFHTTPKRFDVMEFFDDKKHYGENEVKHGRHWEKDELRIKSNQDLHKLWFVLLKERNMLKTMEHECNEKMELFPSPERIDKVEMSMENLESVVRERNKAYYLLETGETGERPGKLVTNSLGINHYYKASEHVIPAYMNQNWFKSRQHFRGKAVRKFVLLYRERLYNEKRKAKNRDRNQVMMLMRRNPNLDVSLLREKYPTVDIDKLIRNDQIRGHYIPK